MTSGINERPYLSIGEVLGLLLEEFPDVTISKIRFLESQGLIEPERTASGYRKFFDADVERLKVILREQRENFLPLRVIRDRLETGAIDDTGAMSTAGSTSTGYAGGSSAPAAPRGLRNVRLAAIDRPPSLDDTGTFHRGGMIDTSGDDSGAIEMDSTGSISLHAAQVRTDRHPAAQLRPLTAPAAIPPPPAMSPPRAGTAWTSTPSDATSPLARPALDLVRSDVSAAASAASAASAAPPAAPVPVAAAPAAPVPPAPVPAAPAPEAPTNDLYVRSEICSAAGITSTQLAELESYGLVTGRGTGSNATYTVGDLAIVRAAAGFLSRGIDARHLRAWRQSAEREASLFEQRILPLLRQRNPQARHDAIELLTELAGLGAQLREAIVLGALRHHLEP